jgi:hypothetical protein
MKSFRTRKEGFGTLQKTLSVFLEHCSCVMVVSSQIPSFVFFNSSIKRKSNFCVYGHGSASLWLLLFGFKPKVQSFHAWLYIKSNTWQYAYVLPYYFDIPCIWLKYILLGFYPMNSECLIFIWCVSPRYKLFCRRMDMWFNFLFTCGCLTLIK